MTPSPESPARPRQPGVLAWLRLARIFQKINTRSAQHFRDYQLSTAQFDALAQIGAAEGLSQQQLATALFVTKGNISQIIGRMEQLGLIVRQQEGRSNALFLTEAGRQLYALAVPRQEALIAELFATLSSDEQQHLLRLLRKLDQGVSNSPSE